jgi:hypothetical protein
MQPHLQYQVPIEYIPPCLLICGHIGLGSCGLSNHEAHFKARTLLLFVYTSPYKVLDALT